MRITTKQLRISGREETVSIPINTPFIHLFQDDGVFLVYGDSSDGAVGRYRILTRNVGAEVPLGSMFLGSVRSGDIQVFYFMESVDD